MSGSRHRGRTSGGDQDFGWGLACPSLVRNSCIVMFTTFPGAAVTAAAELHAPASGNRGRLTATVVAPASHVWYWKLRHKGLRRLGEGHKSLHAATRRKQRQGGEQTRAPVGGAAEGGGREKLRVNVSWSVRLLSDTLVGAEPSGSVCGGGGGQS
jgi:hypothetical protein